MAAPVAGDTGMGPAQGLISYGTADPIHVRHPRQPGERMTEPQAHAALSVCENCGSVLQGSYCHVCGQHAHNPLHNFAHALEEVFESFWHLDGRIFRTVRDLFVPGRVAAGYLAGHRVRYIAPLRLFVIMSLLTFFVGKATLHIDKDAVFTATDGPVAVGRDAGPPRISQGGTGADAATVASASAPATLAEAAAAPKGALTTIDAVIADRNRQLGEFRREAIESDGGWLLTPLSGTVQSGIDDGARSRMRKLGASEAEIDVAMARADLELEKAEAATRTAADKDAADDGWVARWMKKRGDRFMRNSEVMRENPDEFIRLFLGAVPGALFLLVPLFALFLKVVYIGSGRGYLEHLVVALYSHAFLLAALLLLFALTGVAGLAPAAWIWPKVGLGIASMGLFFVVPAYLLAMQRRVYAQRWWVTILKFLVIGNVYTVLLTCALLYAVIAGLSS